MSRATGLGLVGILAIALALRLFFVLTPHGIIDADEAIVGLMGRHVLRGEFPVFYYGQSYMGGLEAHLAALAFALGGASPLILKLVRSRAGARPRVAHGRAGAANLGPGPGLVAGLLRRAAAHVPDGLDAQGPRRIRRDARPGHARPAAGAPGGRGERAPPHSRGSGPRAGRRSRVVDLPARRLLSRGRRPDGPSGAAEGRYAADSPAAVAGISPGKPPMWLHGWLDQPDTRSIWGVVDIVTAGRQLRQVFTIGLPALLGTRRASGRRTRSSPRSPCPCS